MKKTAFALSFVLAVSCSLPVSAVNEQLNNSLAIGGEEIFGHSLDTLPTAPAHQDEVILLSPLKTENSQSSSVDKQEKNVLSALDIEEIVRRYKDEDQLAPVPPPEKTLLNPIDTVEEQTELDIAVPLDSSVDQQVVLPEKKTGIPTPVPAPTPAPTATPAPVPAPPAVTPSPSTVLPPAQDKEKDNILATIQKAIRQYKADEFSAAVSNLDYAT
ncbi:MAG: hypothetical protein D3923_18065, partial [Candidatus Electrothrix sp. AR3]|nr:hypothetical protein [Candidatus Electrothrix sp. AR3]